MTHGFGDIGPMIWPVITVAIRLWQDFGMQDNQLLALLDTDRRRLVRAATRLLGPADAEDAVQDAYVRALEADALELNAAQAWLLTVVRNLAIDVCAGSSGCSTG